MAYYFCKKNPKNNTIIMFDWVLNMPLLPVKNKETNCYMKNLKF